MKRSLLILTILIMGSIFVGCAKNVAQKDLYETVLERGKLVVGVKFDTKPFGYLDKGGNPVGFDVDLARGIAKALLGDANKVQFVAVTPANRIMTLNSAKVDMVIATMSVTSQRRKVVDFSKPYYIAGQALMVNKGSEITSLSELGGKKVVVVFGSTAEKNIRLTVPDAIVMGYKSYIEAYRALKSGNASAITSDDTILMGFALDDSSVKLLPKRYSREPYAIAFRKDENSRQFKHKVNSVLTTMLRDGQINQLKSKWIRL